MDTATDLFIYDVYVGDKPITAASTPDSLKIYVTDFNDGTVSVIDTIDNTVIATIAVGAGPVYVAIGEISPLPPPPPPPPNPKVKVSAAEKKNRFLTQTEICNIVRWKAPAGLDPVKYLIYRNASLTRLAGKVSGKTFVFSDCGRKPNTAYTYYIVAVTENNEKFLIGNTKISTR